MNDHTLSDSEWKLMKPLWEKSPRTLGELVDALAPETGWTKSTVFVMLKRLIAKEAIHMEAGERSQKYYPAVTREEASRGENESFLSRVYDGSVSLMMSAFAGQKKMTKAEIDELRHILDEAEKKGKDE